MSHCEKESFYFYLKCPEFIESKQENSGNLQVLLAKMYSQATFSIMFEQLDLNENGKIDPHEIGESLEDQIKPRPIKGNLNHNMMKLIVLSSFILPKKLQLSLM